MTNEKIKVTKIPMKKVVTRNLEQIQTLTKTSDLLSTEKKPKSKNNKQRQKKPVMAYDQDPGYIDTLHL